MRSLTRVLLAGLLVTLGLNLVPGSPASAASGGPVVLMGIDAEDGVTTGNHGPIAVYRDVVSSVLAQTSNGGTGMLVIGAGKAPTDDATRFWTQVATGAGVPVTFVNGAAIASQSFAGFKLVAVASSVGQTPSGGMTQAENNALAGRQSAVAAHVNGGGGLVGLSQTGLTNPYAYLGGVGSFTVGFPPDYQDITPTAAGTAVGITNALDVCCWHDEYLTFPSFLGVLATNAATGRAAAIGGADITVPTDISLDPPADTNPVGTPHTVTATVLDDDGDPFPGQAVTFTVSGPNAGAAGTCNPPSCQTNAAGQVSFTYTGSNAGTDIITACFTSAAGAQVCATATKLWFVPTRIAINDVTVTEGDTGLTPPTLATFTMSLNQPAPPAGVTVLASTANQSATAPADYAARTNVLVTFAGGQQTQPFTVQVVGDNVDEPTETFAVNLTAPTNATIADPQGIGTILDDERNGAFSCRASSLRLGGLETAVANGPNAPCIDGNQTVLTANLALGGVSVSSGTLNANTNQTPDNLESSAPSVNDNAVASATVERANVGVVPLLGIAATAVQSQARVQCSAGPGGLTPTFASSSSIASLRINGSSVSVNGSATINLPLGLGSVQINRTVTTPTSVTQQAIRIVLLGIEVVIAEAKADFSGNPCTE